MHPLGPRTKTPDGKDDTNGKKGKGRDPTYVVRSPARNRAAFSGNHGRSQPRIRQIYVRNDAAAESQRDRNLSGPRQPAQGLPRPQRVPGWSSPKRAVGGGGAGLDPLVAMAATTSGPCPLRPPSLARRETSILVRMATCSPAATAGGRGSGGRYTGAIAPRLGALPVAGGREGNARHPGFPHRLPSCPSRFRFPGDRPRGAATPTVRAVTAWRSALTSSLPPVLTSLQRFRRTSDSPSA